MADKYSLSDFLSVKSSFGPSFSPDASMLAFQSNDSGVWQLYLLDRNTGESEQITSYDSGIGLALFSPFEDKILFSRADSGSEKYALFLYDVHDKKISQLTPDDGFRRNFCCWSRDGKKIAFSSNEVNGKDFFVYVMDLETGEQKCVFDHNAWSHAAAFSPDRKYIVISKIHSNANQDYFLVDLDGGKEDHLTPHEGLVMFRGCQWLPDSSGFYFRTDIAGEFLSVYYFDVKEKKMKCVMKKNSNIEGIALSRDGDQMAVMINEHGYSKVELYDPTDFSQINLPNMPQGLIGGFLFSSSGEEFCFTCNSYKNNAEVFVMDVASKKVTKITDSKCDIDRKVFVEEELCMYKSFDGLEIPYFKFVPRGESQVPVIVILHGGPASQYRPSFSSLVQYFVYNGYAVIAPNIRGSTGYGKTFMAADDLEKRFDCFRDLECLHEEIVKTDGLDAGKVALFGGSYGGYMVLSGLSLQPKLWSAGVNIVGIFNFVTYMENTSPYRRENREAEYGSLENHRDLLERLSPINYVEDIEAPLFVIHGKNDPRVPLIEAEQVVKKLSDLGKEVELVVYEDEGHGLSKLKNRLDAYGKVVTFLDSTLKKKFLKK